MGDYENRRRHPRVLVGIPVLLHLPSNEAMKQGLILNVSQGGIMFECVAAVKVGDEVLVEIPFPQSEMLQARLMRPGIGEAAGTSLNRCVVRWVDGGRNRFGVEIVAPTEETLRLLRELVKIFDESGDGSDSAP